MDLQFWIGVVVGAVIPTFLWLFKPDWLRQRLNLDRKPPYQIAAIGGDTLRRDPLIGSSLPALESLSWVLEAQVPLKLQEGYTHFLTPDGRECVHVRKDYRGEECLVLMRKP